MYISRPQVSRILSEAREKNIVSITVNDPFSEEYRIANLLKNKYKLLDVMVIDTTEKDLPKEIAEQISRIISSKVCNVY